MLNFCYLALGELVVGFLAGDFFDETELCLLAIDLGEFNLLVAETLLVCLASGARSFLCMICFVVFSGYDFSALFDDRVKICRIGIWKF